MPQYWTNESLAIKFKTLPLVSEVENSLLPDPQDTKENQSPGMWHEIKLHQGLTPTFFTHLPP